MEESWRRAGENCDYTYICRHRDRKLQSIPGSLRFLNEVRCKVI